MSPLRFRRPRIVAEIPLDTHSVVEASAGTGKTFTIEHLVLRLLLEACATLEQILVVTFTEKATADLRHRIRARIDEVLSGRGAENPADGEVVTISEEQRARLEDALFSFERAPIHTIHSFCQRTLSELAFISGMPFAAEIVDAQEAFHDAFRATLRERLASEPLWDRLVGAWLASGKNANGLEQLLYEAHKLRYLETDASRRNAEAISALIDTFDAARLREDYGAAAIRTDSRTPALAAIDAIGAAIRDNRGDPAAIRTALGTVNLSKLVNPTKVKNGRRFPEEMSAETRAFVAAAARAQEAIPLEVTIADAILPAISARLEVQKLERGTMDYDDMLRWLERALRGARGESIAAELRRRFRFALIDEFQDTDDLQWSIFQRVFVDHREVNSLCVIGDPKQAIYSFRGADVFSYLRARDGLCAGGKRPLDLRKNFRSTQAMLDALAAILDQSISEPILTAAIPFRPDVECGRPGLVAQDANGGAVAPITLLEYEPINPRGDSAAVIRSRLGRHIARTLRTMLFDPASQIVVAERAAGKDSRHVVEPRDVFILTRTRAEGVEIATYLREVGVPYAFYKRDGLFQTAEAGDLLEVLRGIEDPLDRSRRLKAWNTPLFVVPYEELASADGAGADHELTARLWEWKELARRERFSDLFDALMTQSGLAFRELLFSDSERELTNYQHILEILLEQALVRRLSLAEIIELLSSYAAERAAPPGDDSNVERLESERKAVQIMTVHLSKGLEADVVILYGGFGGFRDRSIAAAYHDRATTERLVALGKDAKSQVEDIIKRERADEDRRLAYVALTRARVKLFLPFLTEGVSKRSPQSYYRFINQRLTSIAGDADAGKPWRHLFESVAVARPDGSPARQDLRDALASFNPPPNLLTIDTSMDDALRRLSAQRRALEVLSYTALERLGAGESAVEIEDFKIDPAPEGAAPTEDDQLRGGRNVGLFLHEAIERTDVAALAAARDFSEWSARPQAGEVIDSAMRRHQVLDGRWRNAGMEMVFNALRSPIGAGGVVIEDIASCELSREMEFVFPIPERTHPLLTQAADADWRIERGVLIGFVDIVFRHKGKTYFADWKSDRLMNYEPESVRSHVEINYALQAKIYTLGVVRLLGIRDQAAYEARFGGLLYIFLRGIVPDGGGARGIYFHRPRWDEVVSIEAELMNPRAAAALGGS